MTLREERISIGTPDGEMPAFVATPERPVATLVLLMDGMGMRPALYDQARRYARDGFYVVMPNLFYRSAGQGQIENITDLDRMAELNAVITPERCAQDVAACLDAAAGDPAAPKGPAGIIGYCMGGRLAVTAAQALPDRIAAVASLHPGFMATRAENSPHRHLDRISARIYFGLPETDPYLSPSAIERLRTALDENRIDYEMEQLPGSTHGYGVPGNDDYHEPAAERAYARSVALFRERLGAKAAAG
ncbi:dienelactone hydrolase family protein [Sphingobium sp. Sx8-8]|uniref:dienelactone hydrolase family protein n=1 Tax=Sphingobium sp. Sx8-8 TaxID=2933617 RepID=UPI001F5681F0|nr:dienelactone hydrolase family protein [Sphingobium sp. Sx8-8]